MNGYLESSVHCFVQNAIPCVGTNPERKRKMSEIRPKNAAIESGKSLVSLPQDTNTLALVSQRTIAIKQAIKENFKRDKHFGQIPGTKKDILFKPGADLILGWHKIYEDPKVVEATQEWGIAKEVQPFFHFLVRSTIYQYVPGPNGEPVRVDLGSALGECNSGEGRYSHRWLWPSKMSDALHTQAKREGWDTKTAKNGGTMYKCPTEKEEVRSLYNTVLKMAQIRALRSSLAKVCATSEFYGEDFDDVIVEKETQGKGTAENPEVIPPNKEKAIKPKTTKPKTTPSGGGASPKQAAELKFIKDVLARDLQRFKDTGKKLFGDKYKDKGWADWNAEDITKFKDALTKPVDVETGELEPSAQGSAWDADGEEGKAKNESTKPVCATCQTEIEPDRASLYEGVPGGPQCVSCAKKKEIEAKIKQI